MSNFENPYFTKVPQPKYQTKVEGKVTQRPDKGWTWEIDIFVDETYVASLCHPPSSPSFFTEEGATRDMDENAAKTVKLIQEKVYDDQIPN